MYEKRRYGEVVLHRVTEPASNEASKSTCASIRSEGYRARIDTWQGQFAVWSDKGLTDATMPEGRRRVYAPRGPMKRKPGIQQHYDEISKTLMYPPPQFSFEDRQWLFKGIAMTERELESHSTVWAKHAYDVVALHFKGGGVSLIYVSKWKKEHRKRAPLEYEKAAGRKLPSAKGVISLKLKTQTGRPPKTVMYKSKQWTMDSAYLSSNEARAAAEGVAQDNETILVEYGALIVLYTRRRKGEAKVDTIGVLSEVFSYLDDLRASGVDSARFPAILIRTRGMSESTANRITNEWTIRRQVLEKPATKAPGVRRVSKGVYITKHEAAVVRGKSGRPVGESAPKKPDLVDTAFGYSDDTRSNTLSRILGINVSSVPAVKRAKDGSLLVLVVVGKQYRIYRVSKVTQGKNKGKYGDRKLLDKGRMATSSEPMFMAFRRAASREGVAL